MSVRWTPLAVAHLEAAWEYIDRDSSDAADAVGQRIFAAVERLETYPQIGRPGRLDCTRELVIPATPFNVVYRARRDEIQIVAVLHGAQKWPERV